MTSKTTTITIERGEMQRSGFYNYRVLIDGHHRATFVRSGYSVDYYLRDLDHESILADPDRPRSPIVMVRSKRDMAAAANRALTGGAIPSPTELFARRMAKRAEAVKEYRTTRADARRYHVQQMGPRLLGALERLATEPRTGDYAKARDLIAKAKQVPADRRRWVAADGFVYVARDAYDMNRIRNRHATEFETFDRPGPAYDEAERQRVRMASPDEEA